LKHKSTEQTPAAHYDEMIGPFRNRCTALMMSTDEWLIRQ